MASSAPTASHSDPSLWHAFLIQCRVIRALFLREVITRFGRHNLGAVWLVAEPMLFTVGVAAAWSLAGMRHGTTIPVVGFALTGYSSILMWRNVANYCAPTIHENRNLLFHRNVTLIDVVVARVMLEIGGTSASFLFLSLVFIYGGWLEPPRDLLVVLQGWLMLCWFSVGLALFVSAANAFSPVVERVLQPISYLMLPFSGAAYIGAWLSPAQREVLFLLPMVHSVERIREGFFGGSIIYYADMSYMAVVNLGFTVVGLWLLRHARSRVGDR
jgi:capsular polysaccharide transport system permease protein